MLVVALAQILSRSMFNYTLDWAEDLARMALVWSVLLVAPFAYRSGQHVAIGAFVDALPARWLYATGLAINLLVVWICGMLLLESRAMLTRGFTITAASMPVQMVWVYLVVPIALAALILVAIEASLRLLRSLWTGRFDLLLSGVVPVVETELD